MFLCAILTLVHYTLVYTMVINTTVVSTLIAILWALIKVQDYLDFEKHYRNDVIVSLRFG